MKHLVFYAVGQFTSDGEWDPFGTMYDCKREAEQEFREMKPSYPTARLVRVVVTPCDERTSDRSLRAV